MNNYETFGLGGVKLYISKEHRFGTDSVLLGDFAKKSNIKNKTVVDLCSGCGIIPIILCSAKADSIPRQIYAVEIADEAVALLEKTVRENGLNSLKVIHGDLRDKAVLTRIGRESVDLVTANPPYFPENSGFQRESDSHRTARYECDCSLREVAEAAAFLLKFGGEFKMCMTASRLAECIGIMQSYALEPKEIELVPSKKSNNARLFLINAKKGGKSGTKIKIKSL